MTVIPLVSKSLSSCVNQIEAIYSPSPAWPSEWRRRRKSSSKTRQPAGWARRRRPLAACRRRGDDCGSTRLNSGPARRRRPLASTQEARRQPWVGAALLRASAAATTVGRCAGRFGGSAKERRGLGQEACRQPRASTVRRDGVLRTG
uniref:Uncharacterized protein n=1 Tax=Oryza nivara TaxID=4536 RepID=A0A0E0HT29_ORYNI